MIVTILGGGAFANLMRFAQARGRDMWWVGAVNYLLACVLCLGAWAVASRVPLLCRSAVLGICAGLGYSVAYSLMSAGIRCAGVGITSVAGRLSLVVPVTASILIWHEGFSAARAVGLLLVFGSLVMLARGNAVHTQVKVRTKLLILTGLFAVMGVSRLCMKVMTLGHPEGGRFVFMIFMLGTAGLVILGYALWKSKKPAFGEIAHGLVLGSVNAVALFGMVSALNTLDAVVVFPTISIGVIVVSASAGAVLWGEKYPRNALIGMVVGVIALLLLNL